MSYCEWPEFYNETFPKARKVYQCCECHAPISLGETHLHYRGKWNDKFSQGRQHMICRELCMLIRDDFNEGECIGFGDLFYYWPDLNVHYPRNRSSETVMIARGLMAKIRWRERKFRSFQKKFDGVIMSRKCPDCDIAWVIATDMPVYATDVEKGCTFRTCAACWMKMLDQEHMRNQNKKEKK